MKRSTSDPLCGDPNPADYPACQRPKGHDGGHESSENEQLYRWPCAGRDRGPAK